MAFQTKFLIVFLSFFPQLYWLKWNGMKTQAYYIIQ